MLRVILAVAVLTGSGAAAEAQDAVQRDTGDVAAAIRDVISDQIEAFRADDFETAFTFASPGIREMFGTSGRFGAMVREGYPMVWHPGEVRFSDLAERDGRTVQRVLVTDQAGAFHVLEYEMVKGDQGWRIDGVRLLQEGAAGA